MRVGIDIGSVSLSLVVLDNNDSLLHSISVRHKGNPLDHVIIAVREIYNLYDIDCWGLTGNGAIPLSKSLSIPFFNEFSTISAAVSRMLPDIRTVFEMGGQQAKYIHLATDKNGRSIALDDFAASGLCAAGTGSFLDQQATRLGVDIESEFGQLALKCTNPPHIAGRCSVFAKSDMIHHQQRGVPVGDIIAGLCFAVARNFKGTIAKSKRLDKPVAFVGGVASNPGVIRAFRELFELQENELIIPEWHKLTAAIGSALLATETKIRLKDFEEKCLHAKTVSLKDIARTTSLTYSYPECKYYEKTIKEQTPRPEIKSGYLGIDIGSLSTNVVLIDEDCRVISRRYLMTAGRPIEAMQQGLREIRSEIAADFEVLGVGTTGSGRYLIGELVGADIIRNEITAQATGGSYFIPDADTIFEIGGQDSKFIGLENGVVVDFEMNRACAAGTGSFLEEQAERLAINIKTEFASLAFGAENPVSCGERCTVFMESDLVRYEQGGATKEEISAGLALGVVHNYLNKVVGRKKIGKKILFQGGVAWNKAVVAAFETVVGREIIVPPHHDITGAIGAAILVKRAQPQKSNFKGFDLALRKIEQETFLCDDCANMCNITCVRDSGRELFYGSRCEKYDADGGIQSDHPDLVALRNREFFSSAAKAVQGKALTVGIPRALSNWEFFYLWRRFFTELGIRVMISRASAGEIIQQGLESVGSETCFPVKVAHGHLLDLAKRKLDFIFLPSIVTGLEPAPKGTSNYYCPYIQAFPFMANAAIRELQAIDMVCPILRFGEGDNEVIKSLFDSLKQYGIRKKQITAAYLKARSQFDEYKAKMVEIGTEQLKKISQDNPGILLIGRPYNSLDPGVSMDISKKLTDLGIAVIPIDMAPLPSDDFGFLYWQSGRRILRAAKLAKETPGLYPVYISNFSCGPDSFILHHFKQIMGEKPHLVLELDEHSADAGLITRCEAFLDSLPKSTKEYETVELTAHNNGHKRKLLIPRMCDHAELFAASLRHCGLDAEVLPETDHRSLELGRKYTGGRECYPAVLTTGDLLRELEKPGVDPEKVAFFMPTAGGPCRFGQYQHLHQQILEAIGYDVPIYSPTSGNSYGTFPETKKSFRRLAWRGFLTADFMRKFLHKTRPYEKTPGMANALYFEFMKKAESDIEKGGENLPDILAELFELMAKEVDKSISPKPLVGIIGEIYIRNNTFSNNQLALKLERLGLEVDISNFSEWIYFTTEMFRRDSHRKKSWKNIIDSSLKDYFQRKDEDWLLDSISGGLNGQHERPIREIISRIEPYLPISVGGEAMPAMGKAIDMIEHGYAGIVNTLPFTCMPGNIINAISAKIIRDYDNFPWLNMAYEGSSGDSDMLKLGAFAESVRAWKITREKVSR